MGEKNWILYHGSSELIKVPVYGKGNKNNDYGLGFYCTEDIELAREWACTEQTAAWCNRYCLDASGLKLLDLTASEYCELNWLAVLLQYRDVNLHSTRTRANARWIVDNYHIDISDFDVIVGYRADDAFFSIARSFVSNTMPIESLDEALRKGELGNQVVLKSKRAFDQLRFEDAETVDTRIYYPRRNARSQRASDWFNRQEYSDNKGRYIMDMIRDSEVK